MQKPERNRFMYSTSLQRPAIFCGFRKNYFKHVFIQEYSRIFEKSCRFWRSRRVLSKKYSQKMIFPRFLDLEKFSEFNLVIRVLVIVELIVDSLLIYQNLFKLFDELTKRFWYQRIPEKISCRSSMAVEIKFTGRDPRTKNFKISARTEPGPTKFWKSRTDSDPCSQMILVIDIMELRCWW